MKDLPNGSGRTLVDFPYYSFRNISCPEDLENGRKVYSGHAPATSFLDLPTDENVRDYLPDAEGRKKRKYSQVHKDIRNTLVNNPHNFSILNGGITLVARHNDYQVDEKNKMLRIKKPSIINGSQTQGVIKDYYKEMRANNEEVPLIHVTFELILTDDDGLVAETSIARNSQNNVMPLSIAGRLGQLDELEESLRISSPEIRLRKSETDQAEDALVTERLIQVLTALTPEELWPKSGEIGNANKAYTYAQKTKCLRDFQEVYRKAKESSDPADTKYKELYQFYLDVVPQAHELYQTWKTHQGFKNTRLRALVRDKQGNILEVPDGIIFPILAALSAFAEETPEGWSIEPPDNFDEDELISVAKSAYQEIADHNPSTMGKTKACYSALHQITSIYKKLSISR
jgi:hypothetical protein